MQSVFFVTSFLLITSIYSISFKDIDGNTLSMNQYQGKKILLVNIATGSSRASQLTGMQQLHQQYGDSLIIIGFPSNSFGHESRSNAEIKQFCQSQYGVTFLLAEKNSVTGVDAQPLYQWLASVSQNGVASNLIAADFQKFLISPSGQLIGMFSPSVLPNNPELIEAITN